MSIREIVEKWLKENGYDGLYNWSENCACCLDDLFVCGALSGGCEAGMKKMGCSTECGEGCDFHIVPKEKEQPDEQKEQ